MSKRRRSDDEEENEYERMAKRQRPQSTQLAIATVPRTLLPFNVMQNIIQFRSQQQQQLPIHSQTMYSQVLPQQQQQRSSIQQSLQLPTRPMYPQVSLQQQQAHPFQAPLLTNIQMQPSMRM
jgi:citrate synthase